MAVTDYTQLETWQKAMDLAEAVYLATKTYPKEETYGLTAQTRRSAVSVPGNIAEGQGRGNRREFVRFLAVARGSLFELQTQVRLAERFQDLEKARSTELIEQSWIVGKLINGLIRAVAPPAERS